MFDYVIVGAGSAGCVLANRLSEDPSTRVALIEAGGPDTAMEIRVPAAFSKLFKGKHDWDFTTTPQPGAADRRMYWPRGKVLGGSSSINAMMWVRGHRADYDGWGLDGWSYDEVLPVFHRIEARAGSNHDGVYGTGGPLHVEELRSPNPLTADFLRACGEAGLAALPELNAPDNTGYAPTPVTQHRGRRWSAADAYLRPASRRPNLTVITRALVERLVIRDEDGTPAVRGVAYRTGTGAGTAVVEARREVILAAGAIGSPHLLLRSGIGPAGQLVAAGVDPVAESPEVGANLQDHLAAGWIMHATTPVTMYSAEKFGPLLRYLAGRTGPLSSNVAEAVAMIRTETGLAGPDIEILFAPVAFLDHGLTPQPGHGLTLGTILLQPHSTGTITLAGDDPLAAPAIDPGYLSDPRDLERLVAGLRVAERILRAPSLAPHVGEPMRPDRYPAGDAEIGDFVRRYAETLYHPVGTCRMGTDDASVVDTDLRVRGVTGLRVADASVMPRIIRGHTHAPTLMIAEKAADALLATEY